MPGKYLSARDRMNSNDNSSISMASESFRPIERTDTRLTARPFISPSLRVRYSPTVKIAKRTIATGASWFFARRTELSVKRGIAAKSRLALFRAFSTCFRGERTLSGAIRPPGYSRREPRGCVFALERILNPSSLPLFELPSPSYHYAVRGERVSRLIRTHFALWLNSNKLTGRCHARRAARANVQWIFHMYLNNAE